MAWSVKTPYAMFATNGRVPGRHMLAHENTVLEKDEMQDMYFGNGKTVKNGVECERFDIRHLDLVFEMSRCDGSYEFFWFRDKTDNTAYPMFASDVSELLAKNELSRELSGDFKIVRHGAHFGIAKA